MDYNISKNEDLSNDVKNDESNSELASDNDSDSDSELTSDNEKNYQSDYGYDSDNNCTIEGCKDCKLFYKIYSHVTNYTELLKTNLDFINGKTKKTPYHLGPMDDPSPELITNLNKLQSYGFLTVGGQESRCRYGRKYSDYYYDNEQKGFLTFHIELDNEKLVKLFVEKLKTMDLIYTIINMKTEESSTNIPEELDDYYVTRGRKSQVELELSSKEWLNSARFPKPKDREIKYIYWRGTPLSKVNEILGNTLYISVALLEYGKGDIEKMLLNVCEDIGADKYFD